jgi:hypothetical protein
LELRTNGPANESRVSEKRKRRERNAENAAKYSAKSEIKYLRTEITQQDEERWFSTGGQPEQSGRHALNYLAEGRRCLPLLCNEYCYHEHVISHVVSTSVDSKAADITEQCT